MVLLLCFLMSFRELLKGTSGHRYCVMENRVFCCLRDEIEGQSFGEECLSEIAIII